MPGKFSHMTEQDFNTIKLLLDNGMRHKKIMELTGRSSSTLWYVGQTDSFEHYKKFSNKSKYPFLYKEDQPEDFRLPPGVESVIPKHTPVGNASIVEHFEPEQSETDDILRVLENLNQGLASFTETLARVEGKLDDVLETKRPWMRAVRKS